MLNYDKQDKVLLIVLFAIFIITEIIDDIFDHLLGSSMIHSIIQLLLFLLLFFIIAKTFLGYYRKRINKLIPEELMAIMKTINDESIKGVLTNQSKLMKLLDVTKPTIKKRIDSLIELQYISFEENGNNKYLRLTELGNSLIK